MENEEIFETFQEEEKPAVEITENQPEQPEPEETLPEVLEPVETYQREEASVEITEIELYSEFTSEPLISDIVETSEDAETETESTVTTIDYIAETYKNTKTSAECLAFISGALIITVVISICVVISKVLIGY